MPRAKQQGELDGLCGIYAIVNALSKTAQFDEELVFRTCCNSLTAQRWPSTLWEGTTLRDLETMIKECRHRLKGLDRITVTYPFRSTEPKSNDEFWNKFDGLFAENGTGKCAIIGLTEPSLHWLVCYPNKGGLTFIDSGARKNQTVPRAEIYAGVRRTGQQTYRIVRKEVILFERTH
ncbi:hypothetical protein RPE78_12835 [Thioclava litoralis]|uniref:Papain-like cysteine protease AvrRpt2 n=1 Tax=Thioclava litoralis TaxID=3076557 RepID=A0ABZ1DYS6_9RHOB|nr:hypothetical protein RPE78_12835 [Thioclava sp. FTW29]